MPVMNALESANEPKIVLLVRLLNAIDEGNHAFEGLKERIAESGKRPSTRSLRRYLAVLAEAGFPWYFERATNSYRFAEGYSLKRLDLNNGELFGLVALRSLGASLGGTIGSSIDDVTEKLIGTAGRKAKARMRNGSSVAFRLSGVHLDEDGERAFALLSEAERNGRSVAFVYCDKEANRTARTVDPYGFIINGGRVYCVAFDHARRDLRTFAADSIAECQVLARTFVKPPDFNLEAYASGSISGLRRSGERLDVVVRFAPRVAKAAEAARILDDQRVAARSEDGGVEIAYAVTDLDELVRWVLGWGTEAQILAPPVARARAATLLCAMSANYESRRD